MKLRKHTSSDSDEEKKVSKVLNEGLIWTIPICGGKNDKPPDPFEPGARESTGPC